MRHLGLTVAAAVAVAAAVPEAVSPAATGPMAATKLEAQVAARVNLVRGWHGLRPLRLSRGLTQSARRHSRDMAAKGYFDHESAGGEAFWRRIERDVRLARIRALGGGREHRLELPARDGGPDRPAVDGQLDAPRQRALAGVAGLRRRRAPRPPRARGVSAVAPRRSSRSTSASAFARRVRWRRAPHGCLTRVSPDRTLVLRSAR